MTAGPSARVEIARTPNDITSLHRRASRRSMISSITRYTPTRRIASVVKVERSAWSCVNPLNRSDVSSATDRTTTTPSTTTATRTVVRRRLAGADCTAPSYDAACRSGPADEKGPPSAGLSRSQLASAGDSTWDLEVELAHLHRPQHHGGDLRQDRRDAVDTDHAAARADRPADRERNRADLRVAARVRG